MHHVLPFVSANIRFFWKILAFLCLISTEFQMFVFMRRFLLQWCTDLMNATLPSASSDETLQSVSAFAECCCLMGRSAVTWWILTHVSNELIASNFRTNFLWHVRWKQEYFNQKRRPLLVSGSVNSDATMEYTTPGKVTNWSTAGNDVFCAVSADIDVTQH